METDQSAHLGNATSPDVTRWVAAGAILAIPLGSTEQHGPHLSLSTDTDIAVALCRRLADVRKDVLVAPAVAYGASGSDGEHAGLPGTLSIGEPAVEMLVVDLVRSACDTFDRVLLVSTHGGSAEAITRATTALRAESRDVRAHLETRPGEPHAGRAETSLLLALAPEHVHLDRADADDATGAYADEGRTLLESLTAALIGEVARWWGPPR